MNIGYFNEDYFEKFPKLVIDYVEELLFETCFYVEYAKHKAVLDMCKRFFLNTKKLITKRNDEQEEYDENDEYSDDEAKTEIKNT